VALPNPPRGLLIALIGLSALHCGTTSGGPGAGATQGPGDPSSTAQAGSDAEVPATDDAATAPADAQGASTSAGDSSRAIDAADAPAGDGSSATADGGSPFKGVANSACTDLPRLGVSWFYNWTLSPGSCSSTPFVPMVWGHTGSEQTASGIASELATVASGGYRVVLGFNEPDNSSQSNLSVATAISLWPSLTTNASVRVGSPATQANTSGQAWMTSFMQQVNADTTGKLRVDFIAAHWYGWNAGSCDSNAAGLESYLKWLEAIPGNRPIWLTEWGCLNQSNPTAAAVQAFFSGAIAMFAKHPRLERYAWYPWTTNNELVQNGSLTPLGTTFAAAPATL
jgi:hypothetical protein